MHDIPGLRLKRGTEPVVEGPDDSTARNLVGLLDSGQGVVVLHHAISAWPGWEGWAEAIGGRFNYRPARMRGIELPSSGYRMGTFTVSVTADDHPICEGLTDFTIDDELYFAPVLTDRITPLLSHDADMDGGLFQDTFDEVSNGTSTGVTCAGRGGDGDLHGGSTLMGWTTTAGSSPIATLLMGDGPSTFENPMFRLLLGNALDWVSSEEAHAAAADDPVSIALP
jgi:type 1 glutamine amidotransferase